jgi:hypothetical protein
MVVHARARQLIGWLVPLAARLPREHRHTVTQHVLTLAMRLHDELVAARHLDAADRQQALLAADIALDQLRQYLTMAWRPRTTHRALSGDPTAQAAAGA